MMIKMRLILIGVMMAVLLAACGGEEATVEEALPTSAAEAVAEPTQPAAEPEPTLAPAPTDEPEPAAEPTSPPPTEAPAEAAPETGGGPAGNLDEYLATVLRNQLAAGPYRTTTTFEDEATPYVIVGEVVPPDSFHVTTTGGGVDSEIILIGEEGWMKIEGVWSPLPAGMGSTMLQGVMQQDPALIGINSNVQFVGSETLDGIPTWVITFDSALEGISTASVKAWIDADRDLIIRQEILGEAGGVESNAVQTVEYDDSITVEPPQE